MLLLREHGHQGAHPVARGKGTLRLGTAPQHRRGRVERLAADVGVLVGAEEHDEARSKRDAELLYCVPQRAMFLQEFTLEPLCTTTEAIQESSTKSV